MRAAVETLRVTPGGSYNHAHSMVFHVRLLATSNAQGELSPLERGMHALNSGMDIRAYAKDAGRKENTIGNEVKAARVAAVVTDIGDVSSRFSQLVEIHAALALAGARANDAREGVERRGDGFE